jgi:biopolymer transport protein ExbB/TolQ
MTITILSSIVAGLVLALIILSIKFTNLRHELKLVERENESTRKDILESKERHKQEIININKNHSQKMADLEQKHSILNTEHSNLKKTHSNSQKKHAKEISNLTKQYNIEITSLAGQQAIDKMNFIDDEANS